MSTLDKHIQVYDPKMGKWTTKEQYKRERDPFGYFVLMDGVDVPITVWDQIKANYSKRFN